MRSFIVASVAILTSCSLGVAGLNAGTTTPLLSAAKTPGGLSIALPQKNVQVIATFVEFSSGDKIPQPKHSYSRYGYLLEGSLKIINTQTGKVETYNPGDFIIFDYLVKDIRHWREAFGGGSTTVKLLMIDQVDANQSSVILE